jgi:hypothetical protein
MTPMSVGLQAIEGAQDHMNDIREECVSRREGLLRMAAGNAPTFSPAAPSSRFGL